MNLEEWKEIFEKAKKSRIGNSDDVHKYHNLFNDFEKTAIHLLCSHYNQCDKPVLSCPLSPELGPIPQCPYSKKLARILVSLAREKNIVEQGEWRIVKVKKADIVPAGEQLLPIVVDYIKRLKVEDAVLKAFEEHGEDQVIRFLYYKLRFKYPVFCKYFRKPDRCVKRKAMCALNYRERCFNGFVRPLIKLLKELKEEEKKEEPKQVPLNHFLGDEEE